MSYSYDYSSAGDVVAILGGLILVISLVSLAVAIFGIIITWKIFKKAGKEGWIALIPLYNTYTLFEITWGNGWYFLLIFTAIIPVLGWIACVVIIIITMVKLAKAFGKSSGFAVGLILLSFIFAAILAFDKSTYLGVEASGNNMTPAGPPVPPQDSFQSARPVPTPQNDIAMSPAPQGDITMNTTPGPVVDNGMNNPVSEEPVPTSQPSEPTPTNTSFCTNCGTSLPEGTVFCPNCGSPKAS